MNDAKMNQVDNMPDPSRRKFLNTAALAGLAGAGLSVGLSACNKQQPAAPAAAPAAPAAPTVQASDGDAEPAVAQPATNQAATAQN